MLDGGRACRDAPRLKTSICSRRRRRISYTKSAFALACSAALLVAASSAVKPARSVSKADVAAARCAWLTPYYKVRGADPYGIAVINRRNVWVVGSRERDAEILPFALQWRGVGWRRIQLPQRDPDSLYAVDFAAPNDVWAVGRGESDKVVRWRGARWSKVASTDLSGSLNDVAVLNRDNVWAVGLQASSGPATALVERWNGRRWRAVPTPYVGQSQLRAVATISGNNVWAVGNQVGNALVEHWNGREWKVIPTPAAPPAALNDIAATSARNIWVVGAYGPPGDYFSRLLRTLVLHWDGTKWSVVPFPVRRGSLENVVALASGQLWVSGGSVDGGPILAQRRGKTWRILKTPAITGRERMFIAAAAKDDIWAIQKVINYSDPDVILHYSCRS